MKKVFSFIISFILILSSAHISVTADELSLTSKSAILMEASTGKIIYEHNPDEILRPASITKIRNPIQKRNRSEPIPLCKHFYKILIKLLRFFS